jgi:anaerobic selenocysteine-containing dehydrogenase
MQVRTYCRICEATCGLVAEVEGGEVRRLAPDPNHPVSRGYACIKGPAMLEVHRDPDRLNRPERRGAQGWHPVAWDAATRDIGARLRAIIDRHGRDAVAVYVGNPVAFSWALGLFATGFLAALQTRNFFNASTLDCQNKFAVAERMFGSYVIQPIPDLDRTHFFLCLGSNPVVSQMSFVAMPRSLERLKAIVARGGRVVSVNPRRTETAHAVGEQVFIRPDTDVFLLMAMLRVVFAEGLTDRAALERCDGVAELRQAAERFSLDEAAAATGVPVETIVELARSFARAPSATAYCSTGVNMGSSGTLAFLAVQALNAVTGNLDRDGGARIPGRALGLARLARGLDLLRPARPSRIGGFPVVATSLPTGVLADEILTPGDGQVKALIVIAGNPLLSAPGGDKLRRALSSLDLLVSIDLYRNETGALGHYVLPATDWLERNDFPLTQVGMQPEPYAQMTPALVEPRGERRAEADILLDIADAAGLRMFRLPGANTALRRFGHARMASLVARTVGVPFRASWKLAPVKLPDQPAGAFWRKVPTPSGRVQLAPPEIMQDVPRQLARLRQEAAAPAPLRLIGRRQRRSHNSWMHNLPKLRPQGDECWLSVHPLDAGARGLRDGARVVLSRVVAPSSEREGREDSSAQARLEVPLKLDEDVMPGTVSLPHGWGHGGGAGWTVAATPGETGSNVNALAADGPGALEPLSGMARFNGIEVELTPA